MKKFSIKSLLIVILALILVFALVACGDKDKGNDNSKPNVTPKPTKDTTNVKAYFNTLWEQSTGIGDEAIGASDDLKVSLGLTVQLDLVDGDGNSQESVDVGILLDLVLDRSSGEDKSTNTAIKAKIYDPSKAENWFTAYYFFNDVDNVYIDYAGQNIKIPFSYLNDTYNAKFYNFIYNDKPVAGKSIAEIITALTANMGKNWDLNTLVGDVMRVFNINVDSLKEEIGGVFEILGLSVDEAFDAQGNINIKNVLTNDTVAGFFVNDNTTTSTKDGVTTYTTQLDPSVLSMLDLLGSSLPKGLTDLLDGLKLYLEFTTKNNAIDSFTIRAGLPALESEIVTTSESKKETLVDVYPVVAITITDLNFAKAKEGEIEKSMAVERGNYTTDVVLDAAVELDLTGITLDATALDQDNYKRFSNVNTAIGGGLENLKLDGTLALTLNGKLELADTVNEDGTVKNGTVAAAALTYKAAGATEAVDIVKASFMNGNLALTVNQDAKVGNVKIVDVLVRLFGDYAYTWIRDTFFKDDKTELNKFADVFFSCDIKEQVAVDENGNNKVDPQDRVITINPDFKGAVWKNIDIVEVFQDLLDDIFNDEEEETPDDSASAQYASDPIITKVSDTIVRALPLVSAKGDKLTIKTNSNANLKKNYGTLGSAINYIGQTWWEKKAPSFIDSIIKADKDKWNERIANALTVAGTTYGNETTDAKKGEAFLNEMFASTAEVVLDISGANGLELSVNVDVNKSAGVGVSVKLGAKAYVEADYTDLTPATDKEAGWYIYTVPEKQA